MCLFTNNCTPPLQLFALSPPSRLPPTPPHIPIPSPMTPTKIAPTGNMPEPAAAIPESTAISSATIPIPPELKLISSEPHLIPPESHLISSEPHLISSESTVKLGSWHEIVIAKPAIMTASPAITMSHPALRINTIAPPAVRVSAFAAWLAFCVRSKRFLLRCMAQLNSKI